MSNTLRKLVEREAGKFLTLSEQASAPLTEEQLAAVERLARAAKWLGPDEEPPDLADDLTDAEALALVEPAVK